MAIAAVTGMINTGSAQTTDELLSGQRQERQTYEAVSGRRMADREVSVNPTPREMTVETGKMTDVRNGFNVKDKKKSFSGDIGFLTKNKKGTPLTIDYGAKNALKAGVRPVDGAYSLTIGPEEITITGYDERGAFYGLQTLREIMESREKAGTKGELPLMSVTDYPEFRYRGVVEGFYGEPWSHAVRLGLIDFYGRNKMNTYLYGPKDDPYHSSPNWRLPYPDDQAANIRELVAAARRNRVDFYWAIHPGRDIRWDEADYQNLVRKFEMMYDLGVRHFALFFDDISGDGTSPQKQAELLNRLNKEFVRKKGDVGNLIMCPTDYSQLWANPTENGSLAYFGRELDRDIDVFWTGAVVCSDLTHETLEFVDSRIKRPALYWWNFPVTDYARHIVMQGPAYGLDTSITARETAGIVSNPMEHGEASKPAIYGVADYGWNPAAYNALDNWERGLAEMMPDCTDAYRTFAIHSCDTEKGYRRDESWETRTFDYRNYTERQFKDLEREFEKVATAESEIRRNCHNRQLLDELSPWLEQMTRTGKRGLGTLKAIKAYEKLNDPTLLNEGDPSAAGRRDEADREFRKAYEENLWTAADTAAYRSHRYGTMKLHPFYINNMTAIGTEYNRLNPTKKVELPLRTSR